MTEIKQLVAALDDIPVYEPDVVRLYRQREEHTPTPIERRRAMEQLKSNSQKIGSLKKSLSKLAAQPARDSQYVWEFSL